MTVLDDSELDPARAARSRRGLLAWIVCVIAVLAFPLLYPTQAPFIADEPLLLRLALEANNAGKLADVGLMGTHGRRYGPGAIWAYQAILIFTHDPARIMSLHILLMQGIVVGSLVWISRATRLWRWGLPAIALSPYLWFYTRHLWDNSFNIPLSVLCLAAYASFLNRPRAWNLMLAVFIAGFMLIVHLMAAPVLPAIILHLLIARRSDFLRFWPLVVTAMLLPVLFAIPYLSQLNQYDPTHDIPNATDPRRFWFALLGARVLSGAWIDYLFPATWLAGSAAWHRAAFAAARAVSLLAFPLTWLGMLIGIRGIARRVSSGPESLAALCLIIVLLQIVLNVASNTWGHAHYYNATWGTFAVLMWVGLDRVARLPWGWLIATMQTAAVAGVCVLLLLRIMQTGGTRDWAFGVTLSSQLQLLRDWSRYDEKSPIHIESDVNLFPISLQTLEALRPIPRKGDEPVRELSVRWASSDPNDARVLLIEDAPATSQPSN